MTDKSLYFMFLHNKLTQYKSEAAMSHHSLLVCLDLLMTYSEAHLKSNRDSDDSFFQTFRKCIRKMSAYLDFT